MLQRRKVANEGDRILFIRNTQTCEGIVTKVREQSVIVTISSETAKKLGYENDKTVVRHSNYTIENEEEVILV